MEQNKSCITINCGCCGTAGSEGGLPVGTIITYMGVKAPKNCLEILGITRNQLKFLLYGGGILLIQVYVHLIYQKY